MMIARRSRLGAAFALTTVVALNGAVGCGGADRSGGGGAPTAKVDAVEVTYYYLPG